MELIRVTVVSQELNEQGENKLATFEKEENITDSHGHNREFYEDIGAPVSPEILEKEKGMRDYIDFDFDDYEYFLQPAFFKKEDFKAVVTNVDFGSTVYTEHINLRVKETARQIINKLNKKEEQNGSKQQ